MTNFTETATILNRHDEVAQEHSEVSHDDLMRSFRGAWGIEVERKPETVAGVLDLAEATAKDESLMPDLVKAATKLCGPIAADLDSTLMELERNRKTNPELAEEMERLAEAEQLLLDGLEELADPGCVFEDALDWLREAVPKHRLHQNNIFLWKKNPSCPLCKFKSTKLTTCPDCGVHLVIADLEPPPMPSVVLAKSYLDLRHAAGDVANGRKPIQALSKAVDNLSAELSRIQRLLQQIPPGAYDTTDLVAEAERVYMGVMRMQKFEQSCDSADLNHGWVMVCKAGVKLRKLTDDLTASLT